MGRLVVPIILMHGDETHRTEGKIDSAADHTLLAYADAIRAGFEDCKGDMVAVGGLGGGKVIGPEFDVEIWAANRSARVRAVVPLYQQVAGRTKKSAPKYTAYQRGQTLIGHDFLQAAESKLDYSKPHAEVLSGAQPDVFESTTLTRAERQAITKLMRKDFKCPKKKR
jgi:hypothetical protein